MYASLAALRWVRRRSLVTPLLHRTGAHAARRGDAPPSLWGPGLYSGGGARGRAQSIHIAARVQKKGLVVNKKDNLVNNEMGCWRACAAAAHGRARAGGCALGCKVHARWQQQQQPVTSSCRSGDGDGQCGGEKRSSRADKMAVKCCEG